MTISAADIREWAISEGREVNERGRIPKEIKDDYYLAHGIEPELGADENGNLAPVDPISDIQNNFTAGEAKPNFAAPKKTLSQKLKSSRGKTGTGKNRRTKLDRFGEHIWSLGSTFVKNRSLALSRVLAMQSPVAGIVLEENIKHGGMVDRLIQPFARSEEKVSIGFAMLAPPLLVMAIEKNPQLFPALEGPLKLALLEWMSVAEPAMKRVAERERNLAEQFQEYDIDNLLKTIFAHMVVEDEETPNG